MGYASPVTQPSLCVTVFGLLLLTVLINAWLSYIFWCTVYRQRLLLSSVAEFSLSWIWDEGELSIIDTLHGLYNKTHTNTCETPGWVPVPGKYSSEPATTGLFHDLAGHSWVSCRSVERCANVWFGEAHGLRLWHGDCRLKDTDVERHGGCRCGHTIKWRLLRLFGSQGHCCCCAGTFH